MSTQHAAMVGDIFHRVTGEWIDDGSETYQGMELQWEQWKVEKVTKCGAWLRSVEWPYKKRRFAPLPGARWVSATKADALIGLIARKRRHISIIDQQKVTAAETLQLAESALMAMAAQQTQGGEHGQRD